MMDTTMPPKVHVTYWCEIVCYSYYKGHDIVVVGFTVMGIQRVTGLISFIIGFCRFYVTSVDYKFKEINGNTVP